MEHSSGNHVLGWLGLLFTVVSAVIAFSEYRTTQWQRKVERALNYYDYFRDVDARKSAFELTKLWDEKSPALNAALAAAPPEAGDKIYTDFVMGMVKTNGVGFQILLTVDFYNSLATCVTAGLCERDTALRFYGRDALEFRNDYFAFIDDFAKNNNPSLTRPLNMFLDEYKRFDREDTSTKTAHAPCHFIPGFLKGLADGLGFGCLTTDPRAMAK